MARNHTITYLAQVKDTGRLEKTITKMYNEYVKAEPMTLSYAGLKLAEAYRLVIGDLVRHNSLTLKRKVNKF